MMLRGQRAVQARQALTTAKPWATLTILAMQTFGQCCHATRALPCPDHVGSYSPSYLALALKEVEETMLSRCIFDMDSHASDSIRKSRQGGRVDCIQRAPKQHISFVTPSSEGTTSRFIATLFPHSRVCTRDWVFYTTHIPLDSQRYKIRFTKA